MIHLTKRLQAICDMVTPGGRICDVGCDHAYVDIRLLQEGKVSSALAMDVGEGPLQTARSNLELTELSQRCELRLSDGLAAYEPGEADTLICAGMGGILMRSLLEAEPEKALSFREMVLSPHTEIGLVRGWLTRNGCAIPDEEFLEDGGKYYTVIRACPEGVSAAPDWDRIQEYVESMPEEAVRKAMVGRGRVLRLLSDDSFRSILENRYGPCILRKFLLSGNGGGATQETFYRFMTADLRAKLSLAENLSGQTDSEGAMERLRRISGEIGMLQVLLFLYGIRDRLAA